MSGLCFPTSSDVDDTITQTFNATDLHLIAYHGGWATRSLQDSLETFKVSNQAGDAATVVFTGIAIRVVGRIDSDGMLGEFGLDSDGSQNGGITCTMGSSTARGIQQNIPLFDSPSGELSPGTHTLYITNGGPPLSLGSFLIFGSSEPAISTQHTESISPPSSTLPQSKETILSSTTLNLPLPHPTATIPPGIQQESTSRPSYTISSYTEVIVTGGSTTTVVIQSTVEVSATPKSRGISQGVLAGAVMGGVLPLILVGVGLWWRRRRRRCLLSQKDTAGIDSEPDMAPGGTPLATQNVHLLALSAQPTSRSPEPVIRSRKKICPRPRNAALSPSESGEEDIGRPSGPTAPYISSTIAEASLVLEEALSGETVDADRQVMATSTTDAKPDSDMASFDPRVEAGRPAAVSEPERGSGPDTSSEARGESNVERAGTRVRRLIIEEDSGVRLAGGRLGEGRREEAGSGEWEVLPPPYQEF